MWRGGHLIVSHILLWRARAGADAGQALHCSPSNEDSTHHRHDEGPNDPNRSTRVRVEEIRVRLIVPVQIPIITALRGIRF